MASLNDEPAFARKTASTTVGTDKITKERIVVAWSENSYCLTALQAPAAIPQKEPSREPIRSKRRLTPTRRRISSLTESWSMVNPRFPCQTPSAQRPNRSTTGVLSFRLSEVSCASATAGGGGGLRPSKFDRGFRALAARK